MMTYGIYKCYEGNIDVEGRFPTGPSTSLSSRCACPWKSHVLCSVATSSDPIPFGRRRSAGRRDGPAGAYYVYRMPPALPPY